MRQLLTNVISPHGFGDHLGHGGLVNGECIECPFHAWQWQTDGKIGSIPYAKNIPPKAKETQIFKYPTVERNNLIYGMLGFDTEKDKVHINGFANIKLENLINKGESIEINWHG